MVKFISNKEEFKVVDLVVVEAIKQPNFFKSRWAELRGRVKGKTADFYEELMREAKEDAFKKLEGEVRKAKGDGVANIEFKPLMREIRSDVIVGVMIKAEIVKK